MQLQVETGTSKPPNGLTGFLASHKRCADGLATTRDGRLSQVRCRGCGKTFSYVSEAPDGDPAAVGPALRELAFAEPAHAPAQGPARVDPPGPLARRRRGRKVRVRVLDLGRGIADIASALVAHRRVVAAVVVAAAAGYALFGLGGGGESPGSEPFAPIGGGDVPLSAGPAEAPASGPADSAGAATQPR